MREIVQNMLNEDMPREEIYYKITEIVSDKEIDGGFENLLNGEKTIFLVDILIREFNNGGFDQYYFNTNGTYVKGTLDVLTLLNLSSLSKLLNDAVKIFNSNKSEDEKYDDFDRLDDVFYSDINYDELYEVCINYITNNNNI